MTAKRELPPPGVLSDGELAVYVGRAKDIFATMVNAVSAMKMYPSDHDTVKTFVDSLRGKFDDFFERFPKLEVQIEGNAFLCADRLVYTDDLTSRSLPFFFSKDGMENLSFFRGLDRRELVEFLELIRSVSLRPGGDKDIVAALWESDFSNIQYYAPDEFLESRILAERRETQADGDPSGLPADAASENVGIKVDRKILAQGRIALNPTEGEGPTRGPEGKAPEAGPRDGELRTPIAETEEPAGVPVGRTSAETVISEADLEELESLISANRLLWPEEELVNLTVEIIYLEEDSGICAESLAVLGEFLTDQIRTGQFPVASIVIDKLQELRSHLGSETSPKAALIDSSLKKMTGPKTIETVEAVLASDVPFAWPGLLGFLRLLGRPALPLAAGLYERLSDQDARTAILSLIRDAGGQDPGIIAGLAMDARPALSLGIVDLLSGLPEEKGIPCMSIFLRFNNRDIRLEAIRALGHLHSANASRVLLGFLDDLDEDLRIQAALKLQPAEEDSQVLHVIRRATAPEFRKRSIEEKRAFLSFLGRAHSPSALAFLTTLLERTTLWPSKRNLEMRLAAVEAIAAMGTAEAWGVLRAAAHGRGKRVREACAKALGRTPPSPPPESPKETHGQS